MQSLKQILFDAERMKYPHTGLYHFCLHLANALLDNADDSREQIRLLMPNKEKHLFKKANDLIPVQPWHKIFRPSTKNIHVWHATHQDTQYFLFNKKVPVVLTIHDLNYFNDPAKSARKKKIFLQELENKIKASAYLSFISNHTLNDLSQHIDISDKPHSVVYNGCNILEIHELKTPKLSLSKPFLFTIGTIASKKNFHVLPSLLVKNDLVLIIAGITQDENYKQKIINEAKKHQVQDRIIFTGPINENDKQWYYKNCEAFVFPSIAEGFGLPVIEAMYFGKPVFLSKSTSLPEIGGDAAFYFHSFEPVDMLQTLEEGLHQFSTMNLSDKLKKRAQMFSWENAALDYLNIYRSLY